MINSNGYNIDVTIDWIDEIESINQNEIYWCQQNATGIWSDKSSSTGRIHISWQIKTDTVYNCGLWNI